MFQELAFSFELRLTQNRLPRTSFVPDRVDMVQLHERRVRPARCQRGPGLVDDPAVERERVRFLPGTDPERDAGPEELLQARARYSDLTAPGLMKQGLQDPGEIALALQALHREDPELVVQLLGSEFRDLPVMKLTLAALAGVAARRSVIPPDQRR